MTKPSVRFVILVCIIIHACSMHVLSDQFVVRLSGEARPGDFILQFASRWGLRPNVDVWGSGNEYVADLRLRCFAYLYHGSSFVAVHMKDMKLPYDASEDLVFYVKPGMYSKIEVRCDYRNKEMSSMARRAGLVFWKTNKDRRTCLHSQGGCTILFQNGRITQQHRGRVSRFLGELPQEKCKFVGLNMRLFCKEITHRNALFGSNCNDYCGLN